MKTMRICLALLVAVSLFAGCTSRNNGNNGNSVSAPVVSVPPLVSEIPNLASGIESGIEISRPILRTA